MSLQEIVILLIYLSGAAGLYCAIRDEPVLVLDKCSPLLAFYIALFWPLITTYKVVYDCGMKMGFPAKAGNTAGESRP